MRKEEEAEIGVCGTPDSVSPNPTTLTCLQIGKAVDRIVKECTYDGRAEGLVIMSAAKTVVLKKKGMGWPKPALLDP